MIQDIFDLCVRLLCWLADMLGTDYVSINVWIFCVIWPIITVGLIAAVIIETTILVRRSKHE